MGVPTINEVSRDFRRDLAAREHDAQHQIATAYGNLVTDLNLDVTATLTAIVVADASGQPITQEQWRNSARAGAMLVQVERAYDAFAVYSTQKVESAQFDVSNIARKYVQESFRALIGEKPTSTETKGAPIPPIGAITAFVGAATTPGSALKGLFDEFTKQGIKDIDRRILKGIAKGENPKSIARDIQRRAEAPVNKARIAAITRTEVMRAQREGTRANFNTNKKLIKRWRWSCAKSARTCIACIVNDGTEHPLDEPMAAHVNCRCTMLPVPISWNELLGVDNIPEPQMPESGMAWFERQGPLTKLRMLGPSRYMLYQAGIPMGAMVSERSAGPWGRSVFIKALGGFSAYAVRAGTDVQLPMWAKDFKNWEPKVAHNRWYHPNPFNDPKFASEQKKFIKAWGGKPASAATTINQARNYAKYILLVPEVDFPDLRGSRYLEKHKPFPSPSRSSTPTKRAVAAANTINTQLGRFADLGYPMPMKIGLSYSRLTGDEAIAFFDPEEQSVYINMENPLWDGTPDADEKITTFGGGYRIDPRPFLVPTTRAELMIHEFGHWMDAQTLTHPAGSFYRSLDFGSSDPDLEKTVRAEISPYAATVQSEFIAEAFTYQMMGGVLSQETGSFYRMVQGPPILKPGETTTEPWPYYANDEGGVERREKEYRPVP